jgi:1,3-beta-glucan synthase
MLVVFVGLIVGPVVGGSQVGGTLGGMIPKDLALVQPTDYDNDDTRGDEPTGTGAPSYSGRFKSTAASTSNPAPTQTDSFARIKLF